MASSLTVFLTTLKPEFAKNPSSSSQPTTSISLLSKWCFNCERFYLENRVKLNIDKTVYFLAAPKNKLHLLPDTPLTVGSLEISPLTKCRNLGALFDAGLKMERQVKSAAKSAFYHPRLIARIRRFLDHSATKVLVHAFVMSRLDNCNSLYTGLPDKTIICLQRVQNAAARLTLRRCKRDGATPLLKELKWLPVKLRINFKATTLAFRCRFSLPLAPVYLSSLLSAYIPARSLRSSSTTSLLVPRARLASYGERSFSFLGPTLLHSLPPTITSSTTNCSFKSKLKTHLLRIVFSP
jgi:hypothetical protein